MRRPGCRLTVRRRLLQEEPDIDRRVAVDPWGHQSADARVVPVEHLDIDGQRLADDAVGVDDEREVGDGVVAAGIALAGLCGLEEEPACQRFVTGFQRRAEGARNRQPIDALHHHRDLGCFRDPHVPRGDELPNAAACTSGGSSGGTAGAA
jgi:hypothetical protein